MKENALPEIAVDARGDPSYEIEPLKFDCVCPRIRVSDPDCIINNWSSIQCENRIKYKSPCTKKCHIADVLRKRIANETS